MSEKQVIDPNKPVTMGDLLSLMQAQAKQQTEQLSTIVRELRKPSDLEQIEINKKEKERADLQLERLENSAEEISKIEKKRQVQQTCLHVRRDGSSRAVYVRNGDFFVCQDPECNAVIFRGPEPPKEQRVPYGIYNNDQFNRLMQTATRTDL